MKKWVWVFLIGLITNGLAAEQRLFIGGDQVHSVMLDLQTGAFSGLEEQLDAKGGGWLALHPDLPVVYGVGGKQVYSHRVDLFSGRFEPPNAISCGGKGPCHIAISKNGKSAFVSNYSSGSTIGLSIGDDGEFTERGGFVQHDGSSVNKKRQNGPHAHGVALHESLELVYQADLGIDKILIFKANFETGSLELTGEAKLAPGSGPRHVVLHPNEKVLYCINELLLTITVFSVDKKGALTEVETMSTLPKGVESVGSTAEVFLHPNGRFLYGTNRGHDSIVVCQVDSKSGKITWVENESTQGSTPRYAGISPDGNWVIAANQKDGTIVSFRVDQKTGALEPSGHLLEGMPGARSIIFVPVK